MKNCELCESPATTYCESDGASLCWDCDGRVHGANFLVARHSRNLLCHACRSVTPWTASGAKLGHAVSVCETCLTNNRNGEVRERELASNNGNDFTDDDDDEEDSDVSDDEEDGENQVVPWSSSTLPPPPASSTTSEDSASEIVAVRCIKRSRDDDAFESRFDQEDSNRRSEFEKRGARNVNSKRPLKDRRTGAG